MNKKGPFWCQFETLFIWKNSINLFTKGSTKSFLVGSFQHSSPRNLSKIRQKLHIHFENQDILEFLSFSVSIRDGFRLQNSYYLVGKSYWTTKSFLVDTIKLPIYQNYRKYRQNLHKNVNQEILIILWFLR